MNILILEDEAAAARQMQLLLQSAPHPVHILATLETVRDASEWFRTNPAPDLIFSDIQLADGNCFELFKEITLQVPVIFTTAYDKYMQQAFKVHSIDYLLKPIDADELNDALDKFVNLELRFQLAMNDVLQQALKASIPPDETYKSKFLIRSGDRLSTVQADEVAFLRADGRIVWLHDTKGHKYIIDDALDGLEKVLNPARFFRLNRRYIVPARTIERMNHHLNGKLHIRLNSWDDKEIFVSRKKAGAFKQWMGGR